MPPYLLIFGFLLAVNCYLHPVIEHRIILVVIHDIELDTVRFPGILDSEVKPLRVTLCVYVVLH